MKARLYKNIDLVRIAVKTGVSEYHLPQNVAWADRKVDRLVVVAPDTVCVDPVDGASQVMSSAEISDLYFNLYSETDVELTNDLLWENLSNRNNHALTLNSKLDLSLCKLYFTTAPVADRTLLLYVIYDTYTDDNYELPQRSVTVEFPMVANEQISLRDIMSTYLSEIPKTVRGIIAWSGVTDPAYITLRDFDLKHNLRLVHTELMRPDMNGGSAQTSQAEAFYLDALDIDFKYSNITNAQNSNSKQKITFIY